MPKVFYVVLFVVLFLQRLDKLNRQLADAEAALEARKKPPEDAGPRIVGEGLVIDEWVTEPFVITGSFFYQNISELISNKHSDNNCRKNEGKDTLRGNKLKLLIQGNSIFCLFLPNRYCVLLDRYSLLTYGQDGCCV